LPVSPTHASNNSGNMTQEVRSFIARQYSM
jgi:hypothetical protein